MRYSAALVVTLAILSPLSFGSAQWLTAPVAVEQYHATLSGISDSVTNSPSRRDPAVAGILSFLIPFGTGSFYAGNAKRGVIHLAVGVGSALLFMGNFCVDECSGGSGADTRAAIGFGAFVVNWVTGTIGAVSDAKSFNRRHATAGATSPAVSSSPSNGRFVFSLAHLSF